MTLTDEQYNAIMRKYELKQQKSYQLYTDCLRYVQENVPGYKDLDDTLINLSTEAVKKKLSGDENGYADIRLRIKNISKEKTALLEKAGLPADYLEQKYECPDCKDTGYVNNEKCHCFKAQIAEILHSESHTDAFINDNNFSKLTYKYHTGEALEDLKRAVSISQNFIEKFDTERNNLLFYGSVGTGKSFLSGCIAKELLDKGHSVIYFSAISFFDTLADITFRKSSDSSLYNMGQCIYNCELLIIDDLGTEMESSFVKNQLFNCLNERLLQKKATVISTNLALDQLRGRYSERVFSRIIDSYTICKLMGDDIRIRRLNK